MVNQIKIWELLFLTRSHNFLSQEPEPKFYYCSGSRQKFRLVATLSLHTLNFSFIPLFLIPLFLVPLSCISPPKKYVYARIPHSRKWADIFYVKISIYKVWQAWSSDPY